MSKGSASLRGVLIVEVDAKGKVLLQNGEQIPIFSAGNLTGAFSDVRVKAGYATCFAHVFLFLFLLCCVEFMVN